MQHQMKRAGPRGKNRRLTGMWAAFVLMTSPGTVVMAAGAARAEEVSLRYTLSPDGPPIATSGQALVASDAPLEVVKLPPLHSPRPLYLSARLGEGPDATFTFVLDESEPGSGYDLLYAD